MSLICSIQEDMRIRMIDDHVNQMINYPEVSFICLIDVNVSFIYRIFVNEKKILKNEKMLKICDGFFIILLLKQKHQI
jgi:hypothetical protein